MGHLRLQTFSSLQNRRFRWLWASSLGSFGAFQMQSLAQGWLAYDLTQSPLALALVMSAFAIPLTTLSLIGGAVADRVNKPRLLIATQAASALTAVTVAVLVLLGVIQYWHLLALGAMNGLVTAFNFPGRQALVREVVDDKQLTNAIGLSNSGMNLMRILGPALGGVAVAAIDVGGVFILITALYILAALSIFPLAGQPRQAPIRRHVSIVADIREGLAYVRSSQVLVALLVVGLVPILLGMPYQQLMPAFAVEAMGLGPEGLGVLLAATGLGSLLGSLGVASLGAYRRKGFLFLLAMVVWGIALLLFTFTRSLAPAVVMLLIVGSTSAISMTLNNTLIQLNTAREMQGRVMSFMSMGWGIMPLGTLPISGLAERIGTPMALAAGAAALVLFAVGSLVWLRRVRSVE